MFVEVAQKAAFTLCPTIELPAVRAAVQNVEQIPTRVVLSSHAIHHPFTAVAIGRKTRFLREVISKVQQPQIWVYQGRLVREARRGNWRSESL